MSDETNDQEIHIASEEAPALTKYEPDFRRVFARGTLLRMSESDENTVQLGFWSDKETGIEVDDGVEATGYQLETEVMMHWSGVLRLRNLLENYIEENAPDYVRE
ncbi:hypothetical protein [Haloferax volcanii]|uniref:hypothetical protein n=1 Tax=Haloferax volcanii TaxID=2246 RepID=UPI003854FA6E